MCHALKIFEQNRKIHFNKKKTPNCWHVYKLTNCEYDKMTKCHISMMTENLQVTSGQSTVSPLTEEWPSYKLWWRILLKISAAGGGGNVGGAPGQRAGADWRLLRLRSARLRSLVCSRNIRASNKPSRSLRLLPNSFHWHYANQPARSLMTFSCLLKVV